MSKCDINNTLCFELADINESGITVKNKEGDIFIRFDECAKNYAAENGLADSKCVATRDITKLTFTFYTSPKTTVVFKKQPIKNLFSGKSATGKFSELANAINRYGYTSYDLS